MKEVFEVPGHVRLNFSPTGLPSLYIIIAFIMFAGVALDIKINHFGDELMNPKSVIFVILSQFVLLPSIIFLFIRFLHSRIFLPEPELGNMTFIAICWSIWQFISRRTISIIWAQKRISQAV